MASLVLIASLLSFSHPSYFLGFGFVCVFVFSFLFVKLYAFTLSLQYGISEYASCHPQSFFALLLYLQSYLIYLF